MVFVFCVPRPQSYNWNSGTLSIWYSERRQFFAPGDPYAKNINKKQLTKHRFMLYHNTIMQFGMTFFYTFNSCQCHP
jgi:hypothetical protein